MLTRTEILQRFQLNDRPTFELEPCSVEPGIWRIKFSHEGDPATLMSQGSAMRLAAEIRTTDPDLAGRIEQCVAEARHSAEDS